MRSLSFICIFSICLIYIYIFIFLNSMFNLFPEVELLFIVLEALNCQCNTKSKVLTLAQCRLILEAILGESWLTCESDGQYSSLKSPDFTGGTSLTKDILAM